MAINFPSSPVDGQIFEVSPTVVYTYYSDKNYWLFGRQSTPAEDVEATFDGGIKAIIFSGMWDLDNANVDIHTFLLTGA
jgi:hypothetical protein